jgi:hypothetical protein
MLINIKILLRYIFLVIAVFINHQISFGQERALLLVLGKGKINKTYSFDSSTKENGYDKTFVKYLGSIKTDRGEEFKILSLARIWGKNRHTSGIVYIYNYMNEYVGKYNLSSSLDLPEKVRNNHLFFTNRHKSDCDSKMVTEVDFSKDVPKEFFLKCKDTTGDIYTFSTEK